MLLLLPLPLLLGGWAKAGTWISEGRIRGLGVSALGLLGNPESVCLCL